MPVDVRSIRRTPNGARSRCVLGQLPMLVIADIAIAAIAVVALLVHLTNNEHSSDMPLGYVPPTEPVSTPSMLRTTLPPPSVAPALFAWVHANLPPSTSLVTDHAAAALLTGVGFRATTEYASCRSAQFLLVTTALRRRAADSPALAGCLLSSLPVAVVRDGARTTEVRMITRSSDPAAARQQARADRRAGGAALTLNPAISMPADVQRVVRAGQLDLRAETVLVALARLAPFAIEAVRTEPAEAAAGLPARSVLLRLPAPPTGSWFRTHVAAGYRPSTVLRAGPHTEWLTWPFEIAPPSVLK
jgi:hypothetical protein